MNSEERKNGVGVIELSDKDLKIRDEQLLALIEGHFEIGGGALKIDYTIDTKRQYIFVKVSLYDRVIIHGIYDSKTSPVATIVVKGDYMRASIDMTITINFSTHQLRFKGKICLSNACLDLDRVIQI
jgi:hypothetical protein